MKAIHKKTGHEYIFNEILGETVTLESPETGNLKRVSYTLFKSQYKMVNETIEANSGDNKDNELKEAQQRAEEVLTESTVVNTLIKIPAEASSRSKEAPKEGSNKKPKVNKEDTAKATKTAKTPKVTGTTSLKTICDELGIDPGKARRIFRSKKIEKPGGSWEWSDPTEIAKIRELLK